MATVALAVPDDGGLERFDEMAAKMKAALVKAKEPIEVKDVIDQAEVARVYAQAFLTDEHVRFAAEVQVWAYRRAGEIRAGLLRARSRAFDWAEAGRLRAGGMTFRAVADRLGVSSSAIEYAEQNGFTPSPDADGRMTKAEFDDMFGVSFSVGVTWQIMSAIPEEQFNTLVAELKRDGRISATAIVKRIKDTSERRIEAGIFELPDERIRIRWSKNRQAFTALLRPGTSLDEARRQLALRRGGVKTKATAGVDGLGYLMDDLQSARNRLDRIWPELTQSQRLVLDEAGVMYGRLDDMASAVAKAMNVR